MPALVTPFTSEGGLDIDAHRHNLATLAERGVEGFLIGGSTGEGPYLEPSERERLLAAARAELGDGPFLLGGVAAESLRLAAWQVEELAEGGADAALVLTPTTLVRGRDREVADFYRDLADRVELPLFLYSVPRVTGYELPADAAARLATVPGIAGFKDSGGQPVRIQAIRQEAPDHFHVYAGNSAAVALSIAAGARGAITASANYAPSLVREVVAAAAKGKAGDAQARLNRLTGLVESRGIAGVKLAAEVSGLKPGVTRAPLRPLAKDEAVQVERSLTVLRDTHLG